MEADTVVTVEDVGRGAGVGVVGDGAKALVDWGDSLLGLALVGVGAMNATGYGFDGWPKVDG